MTSTASHTHRDTLAFMLTILGASVWAMVPAVAALEGEGLGPNVGISVVFAVGGLLGAWSGTTVWRHVSWTVPAIAAGIIAAGIMELRHHAQTGSFGIETSAVAAVAAAAAGGAVGAMLGRSARSVRRTLVAAWITFSGPGLVGVGAGVSLVLGYVPTDSAVWLVYASFLPGAILAAVFCRNVHPGAFFSVLFLLLLSFFLIAASKGGAGAGGAFVGALLFSAVVAAISAIPIRIAYRPEAAAADLPTATLVDRSS